MALRPVEDLLTEMFGLMDGDKDGHIDEKEGVAFSKIMGEDDARAANSWMLMCQAMDKDASATIELPEWVGWVGTQLKGAPIENVVKMLDDMKAHIEANAIWQIPKNTADRQAADRAFNAYQDWALFEGKNAKKRVTVSKFNHDYANTKASMGAVDNIGRTADLIKDDLDNMDWYLHGSKNSRIAAIESAIALEDEKLLEAKKKLGVYQQNSTTILEELTDEHDKKVDLLKEELRQYERPNYVGPFGKKSVGRGSHLARDFHYSAAEARPAKGDSRMALHQDDQEWALRKLPAGCPK